MRFRTAEINFERYPRSQTQHVHSVASTIKFVLLPEPTQSPPEVGSKNSCDARIGVERM